LEKLTELSKAEADLARAAAAGGVPVPALNPIGGANTAEDDVTSDDEPVAGVAGSPDPEAVQGTEAASDAEVANADTDVDAAASPEGDQPAAIRPLARPGEIVTSALQGLPNDPQEQAVAILNEAATASDVSYAIHLSTLWSIDEAQRYWQAMQTAVPDILVGKTMQLEEVAATGGDDPFYRVLTTPFTSDPEAQAACDQIKSKLRTHDCSVVVQDLTAGG
ncbi:MAG: SPOR domain-containing protein, partial [Pseudomonadota bacterium]